MSIPGDKKLVAVSANAYRTEDYRILYGTSNTGFTAVYGLFRSPDLANAYIAASGVLDDNFVWWLSTMGRLRPGWSVERATAYLQTISPALFRETVSRSGDDGSAKSPPMRDTIIASTWPITGAS
jgi:hypothetical protein